MNKNQAKEKKALIKRGKKKSNETCIFLLMADGTQTQLKKDVLILKR